MAIELTQNTDIALQQSSKNPNIVLEIEGIDTLFGAVIISKFAEYGDPIKYGDPGLVYGGKIPVEDQRDLITFGGGTSTTITQNVDVDRGRGNSIQSMQIALVDQNNDITQLISPGQQITEALGRKCRVYYGLAETAWPEDYIILFRGNIDEINSSSSGSVILNIAHPDRKKRANLFTKTQAKLTSAIDAIQTTITVDDASTFFSPVTGPSGTIDDTIKYYVRIDDEVLRYEGISGNDFITITRGQLGTVASAHDVDSDVDSIITLSGNVIGDIALKLLMSGLDGPWVENLPIGVVENREVSPGTFQSFIILKSYDLIRLNNARQGDFLTITGSAIPGNNIALEEIIDINFVDDNTEIRIGTLLTPEITGTGEVAIQSQYDVWGEGRGMGLTPDEVDIEQHLFIQQTFFPVFDYEIFIKDSVDDGKEFLDSSVYNPAGCFSLVRKAQASLGIHAPPLPNTNIPILNDTNVINPETIRIKRSLSKNFYNGVVYRFDESVLFDRFLTTVGFVDGDSRVRFGSDVPSSFLAISAPGLRSDANGVAAAQSAAERRLKTYRFGAEFIDRLQINLQAGLELEAGDIVLLDMASLNISDIQTGTRAGEPRLYRVEKKTFNIQGGQTPVAVSLTDTSFDKDTRFGLVSPSSFIRSAASERQFTIKPSFNTDVFGDNEFRKWIDYIGSTVTVRNTDFTIVSTANIEQIAGNVITLDADLGFIPVEDMVMTFASYQLLTDNDANNAVKLVYVAASDDDNDFADGRPAYRVF